MCVSIFLFINMLFRAEYYNEYSINRLKTVLLSAMGGVQWCIKRRLLPDMGCNSRQELDSVFKELSLWKVKGDKNQRQKSKNWEDAVLQDQGASEKLHRKKTLCWAFVGRYKMTGRQPCVRTRSLLSSPPMWAFKSVGGPKARKAKQDAMQGATVTGKNYSHQKETILPLPSHWVRIQVGKEQVGWREAVIRLGWAFQGDSTQETKQSHRWGGKRVTQAGVFQKRDWNANKKGGWCQTGLHRLNPARLKWRCKVPTTIHSERQSCLTATCWNPQASDMGIRKKKLEPPKFLARTLVW